MIRAALAVALADFRQRSRTPKLLVVGVLTAYLGKLLVVDAQLLVGGEYTGVGTAAWYGATVASAGTVVLFLSGFVLVRGGIDRDRTSNLAAVLASTPLSNGAYLFGKFLSNVAVLAVVTAVLAGATAAAFLLGGTGGVVAWDLLSPFVLITLPAMIVVAAAAVFAETVSLLRGTLGTALYVFGALAVVIVGGLDPSNPFDPAGLTILRESMARELLTQFPSLSRPISGFAYTNVDGGPTTFEWSGIQWTVGRLAERGLLLALAAATLAVATVSFDRFDSTAGVSLPSLPGGSATESDTETVPADETAADDVAVEFDLPPVSIGGFTYRAAIAAELRMVFRRSRWWWLAVAGVVAASALAPVGILRSLVVPLGFLLGITVWSELGSRERRQQTAALVFSTTSPVKLLVPTYVAGVAVAGLLTAPAAARYVLAGQMDLLVPLAGAATVVPAVAVAVGVWTARPRLFETAFLIAWYLGPMNGFVPFDFLAVSPESVAAGVPIACLLATPIFLGVAAVGRLRR